MRSHAASMSSSSLSLGHENRCDPGCQIVAAGLAATVSLKPQWVVPAWKVKPCAEFSARRHVSSAARMFVLLLFVFMIRSLYTFRLGKVKLDLGGGGATGAWTTAIAAR